MSTDTAWYSILEREGELLDIIVNDAEHLELQPWKVLRARKVKRIYQEAAELGMIVHESDVFYIEEILMDNIIKLYLNTLLCGHLEYEPELYLEEQGYGWIDERWLSNFYDHIIDPVEKSYRISDMGFPRLTEYLSEMISTPDLLTKLYWADRILSVAHYRSDLAAWFIQGGSATLDEIKEWVPEVTE